MNKQNFKERHQYNDRFTLTLLWMGNAACLVGIAYQLFSGNWSWSVITGYGITLFLLSGLLWWLSRLEVKLSVNKKRIKFKMLPFHRKSRKISWREIDDCAVIKTSPLAQSLGGNIHLGGERWFSLNGRNGLSLHTKDGNRYFIGCSDVSALADTLEEIR